MNAIGYPLSLSRTSTHPCLIRVWCALPAGTNFLRFSYRKVA